MLLAVTWLFVLCTHYNNYGTAGGVIFVVNAAEEKTRMTMPFSTSRTVTGPSPIHRQLLWEKEHSTITTNTKIGKSVPASSQNDNTVNKIHLRRQQQEEEQEQDSILSNPWWLELSNPFNMSPAPRRGHSSTLYTILDPDHHNHKKNNLKEEYMIVSGGFTVDDWTTFPVWSYNVTAAVNEDTDVIVWKRLTQPHDEDQVCPLSSRNDNDITRSLTSTINHNHHHQSSSSSKESEDLWENAEKCTPQARVGHISAVYDNKLYVFGGLLYNKVKGVFYMETEPWIYRLDLSHTLQNNNSHNGWERILPRMNIPPPPPPNNDPIPEAHSGKSILKRYRRLVNRGEVVGGHWKAANKLVVYGGIHVRDINSTSPTLHSNSGSLRQEDMTLDDMWSFDFTSDTWEVMDSAIPGSSAIRPTGRTSHAATIVKDELIVCGGLRKLSERKFDGTTVWEQLTDVWIFNLKDRVWKERIMSQNIGRSQHSLVGWEDEMGSKVATFGGYKTDYDTLTNSPRPITYVFKDTLVSYPIFSPNNDTNETYTSSWQQVIKPPAYYRQPDSPTRREHTAVLTSYGNMIIWGGRFQDTNDAYGVWSISLKSVEEINNLEPATDDGDAYDDDLRQVYVLITTVMFVSMAFTYICGTLARGTVNDDDRDTEDRYFGDGREGGIEDFSSFEDIDGGGIFGRSNGLGRDAIETLPIEIWKPDFTNDNEGNNNSNSDNREINNTNMNCYNYVNNNNNNNNASASTIIQQRDSNNETNDDSSEEPRDEIHEEDCCPICLIEYKEGDEVRVLPCKHHFHKACADSWLSQNASCPACRHSLDHLVVSPMSPSFITAIITNNNNNDDSSNRSFMMSTWAQRINFRRRAIRALETEGAGTDDETEGQTRERSGSGTSGASQQRPQQENFSLHRFFRRGRGRHTAVAMTDTLSSNIEGNADDLVHSQSSQSSSLELTPGSSSSLPSAAAIRLCREENNNILSHHRRLRNNRRSRRDSSISIRRGSAGRSTDNNDGDPLQPDATVPAIV